MHNLELITRRKFFRYTIEAGLTAGLIGGLSVIGSAGSYVRPPGALPPSDFTSRCLRCSICSEVCPTRAISLLDIMWDIRNISTPVIDPAFGGCVAWQKGCLRCAQSCPSGALNSAVDLSRLKIGRVRLKQEACVNCMVCFQRCPVEGAVLFPNPAGEPFTRERDVPTRLKLVDSILKPYINLELCVGCGLCVHYCPPKIMFLDPIEKQQW
jgi:ferredoxin-type protein NapG